MHIQQRRGSGGTFDEAPHPHEMPAFAMVHSGIGNPVKELHPFFNAGEKGMRAGIPELVDAGLFEFQIEPIQLLPHLRADLLAYLPGIFARGGNGEANGSKICGIKRK